MGTGRAALGRQTMTPRPNLIFIVADDLGYADLGCYGGRDAAFGPVSPVLDQLAANGLKLTQGYSNSPVCSPTRFALMTARYQYRLRGAAEEPINSKSRGSTTLGPPFFLSLHYTAPHWPWETRDDEAMAQEVKTNLFHLHGGNIETYRRMIHHMDEGIGRIMALLEAKGLARDTLVVFTSDNGG